MSDKASRGRDILASLGDVSNPELLHAVDVILLELERRLLRYVEGSKVVAMADEGLILSVRAAARLAQAQSATNHARGHLQVVGVGDWQPRGTEARWDGDGRVVGDS